MFFSIKLSGFKKVLLIYLTGLLCSCSIEFNDVPTPGKSIRFADARFSCLSEVGDRVNDYFNGRLNKAQVDLFMTCIENALLAFQFHAEGERREGYYPEEIRNFLNDKITRDMQISKELVDEAMRVKVVMAGGGENFITKEEYRRLVDLISVLKDESIKALPHIKLYKFSFSDDNSMEKPIASSLQQAKLQIVSSIKRLSGILSTSYVSYSFESFERLLIEIRSFLGWDKFYENTHEPKQLIEILKIYKELMVGHGENGVEPHEWEPLLTSLAGWYGIYLDYNYLVKDNPMLIRPGLDGLLRITDESIDLFQNSIRNQPRSVIPFKTLYKASDILERLDLLPMGIKAESANYTMDYLLNRVFRSFESSGQIRDSEGLTLENLNEIRKELNLWSSAQKFLNDVAHETFKVPSQQLFTQGVLQTFDFSLQINTAIFSRDPRGGEIDLIVSNTRPMFQANDEKVMVVYEEDFEKYGLKHDMHNLSRMNVIRAISRLLIRGYASRERAIEMSGVTIDEMQKFHDTAKRIGADLKIMDPRGRNSGERAFTEGNLFTFSGNGINPDQGGTSHLLTQIEAMELIALLYSGGKIRTEIYNRIYENCHIDIDGQGNASPEESPRDIFDKPMISRNCFNFEFSRTRFKEFSNLPYFQNYISKFTKYELKEFLNALKHISRDKCDDEKWVSFGELATMSTILQYIEVLFVTYDLNSDGVLNEYEAFAAYPRLRGFINQKIFEVKEKEYGIGMQKSIYAFLLSQKRFPETKRDYFKLFGYWIRYFSTDTREVMANNIREKAKRFFSLFKGDEGESEDLDEADLKILEAEEISSSKLEPLPEINIDRKGIIDILVELNERTDSDKEADASKCEVSF